MARCEALMVCDAGGDFIGSQCPEESTREIIGIDPDGGLVPHGRTVDLCWCHAETLLSETREVEFIPSNVRASWATAAE